MEAAMGQHDEYLTNARECRALAEKATSPESKADWLRLAEKWERLSTDQKPTSPTAIVAEAKANG